TIKEMADWDSESFEPAEVKVTDKWEGEDEDDELKDNWDDDDDAAAEPEKPKTEVPVKKGGKKYLQMKLKEKEEEQRRLAEERRLEEEKKSPEEKMKEKLLAQKLSEESDLAMTQELFSGKEAKEVSFGDYTPRTKADFIKFSEVITEKLKTLESSPHYEFLIEEVIKSCTICLSQEQLKKISSSLNALSTEKLKQERAKKGTKKSQKAKLGGGLKSTKNDAMDDFSTYNDFDDFM
uniref:Eukaryotic translation initiation factor 3 subunit J n=1 Tax=Ciona savignyi TaxID=51511 RepID=H2YIB5_CIOSA